MKFIQCINRIKAVSNKAMNFVMTIRTKIAQIIRSVIFFFCIYMMNFKSFGGFFADSAFLLQSPFPIGYITPLFVSGAIVVMFYSFTSISAFSRTKFRFFLSKWPRFKQLPASFTGFWNSWFSKTFTGTKPGCFFAIISREEIIPTIFANNCEFTPFSHEQQLYAN